MAPTTPSIENARELRDLYEEYAYEVLHVTRVRSWYTDINCHEGLGEKRISMFNKFLVDHGMHPCEFFSPYIIKIHALKYIL